MILAILAVICGLRHGDLPLAWSEEFDAPKINERKWFSPIEIRQGCTLWHPSNLTIKNGSAHFAIKEIRDHRTLKYESAALISNFTFKRGYLECRCKFPKEVNCDYSAALWLMGGGSGQWSAPTAELTDSSQAAEIDIFETFTRWREDAGCNSAFHWGGYGDKHNLENCRWDCGGEPGWHIIGFTWTDKEYIVSVDGKEVVRTDLKDLGEKSGREKSQGVLNAPARIILSCEAAKWAGPNWKDFEENAPAQDEFVVDYIRVYHK